MVKKKNAPNHSHQRLRAERLVPDHPGRLGLEDLGLPLLLDVVLAEADRQSRHVVASHAASVWTPELSASKEQKKQKKKMNCL